VTIREGRRTVGHSDLHVRHRDAARDHPAGCSPRAGSDRPPLARQHITVDDVMAQPRTRQRRGHPEDRLGEAVRRPQRPRVETQRRCQRLHLLDDRRVDGLGGEPRKLDGAQVDVKAAAARGTQG
jgi:hypothetical protein